MVVGGEALFAGKVCGGEAVVDSVEGLGEDRGENADGGGEWVCGPFECGNGFA
jgi:hypothetical protein